jgi:hypothetical protein
LLHKVKKKNGKKGLEKEEDLFRFFIPPFGESVTQKKSKKIHFERSSFDPHNKARREPGVKLKVPATNFNFTVSF